MKPKYHQDCLKACVASILEIELNEVPDFHGLDNWGGRLYGFLLAHGYTAFSIGDKSKLAKDRDYIMGIKNAVEDIHFVIWRNNKVIHFPHQGIVVEELISFIDLVED